jgi:hypothetical protein
LATTLQFQIFLNILKIGKTPSFVNDAFALGRRRPEGAPHSISTNPRFLSPSSVSIAESSRECSINQDCK